jgi:ribosomal biogenesis protein LAS1
MDAMFNKWDPVLQQVAGVHSSVLLFLSEELVHNLVLNAATESSMNTQAEGLFLWLEHLLTAPVWELQRPSFPRDYILAVCNAQSTHWTRILAEKLQLQQQDTTAVMSHTQITASTSPKMLAQPAAVENFSRKLQEHGWGFAEKWDSRPLGITSSN